MVICPKHSVCVPCPCGLKNILLKFFKDTLTRLLIELEKKKSDRLSDETKTRIDEISKILTLDKLFDKYWSFIKRSAFHTFVKNQYDSTKDYNLKDALRAFYNISRNSLSDKYKYEYFLIGFH